MKGGNGIIYEADNTILGPAMFYLSSTEKWAISNVGFFADREDPRYVVNTSAQVTGTDANPELFRTARMSPGSLRYYGLGLKNGSYTITLQFAEISFEDQSSRTWKGLGRRVFDIYIQGILREKDFDISKAAGGVYRATEMKFNVTVSENYLEIHLFWAGKGTCCIPQSGFYGPLISTVHAATDSVPTGGKNLTWLIVGIAVPAGILGLMLVFAVFYIRRKSGNDLEEGAIKQLSVASHQGTSQFITEIDTISALQHRNLVRLYGCCIEGNRRILVYEYLENKSIDQALFDKKTHISTRVAGTIGYLAPEYALRGHLTEKADIFSFGVVALEILSGRPNFDNSLESEMIFLLDWAWTLYEKRHSLQLVDPRLTEFDENEATRMIHVALLCTQASPIMRPAMSRVVGMLTGDIELDTRDISKPSYLTDWNFNDVTRSLLEEEDSNPLTTSMESKNHDNIQHGNATSSSSGVDISPSPINVTETMFSDIIINGRPHRPIGPSGPSTYASLFPPFPTASDGLNKTHLVSASDKLQIYQSSSFQAEQMDGTLYTYTDRLRFPSKITFFNQCGTESQAYNLPHTEYNSTWVRPNLSEDCILGISFIYHELGGILLAQNFVPLFRQSTLSPIFENLLLPPTSELRDEKGGGIHPPPKPKIPRNHVTDEYIATDFSLLENTFSQLDPNCPCEIQGSCKLKKNKKSTGKKEQTKQTTFTDDKSVSRQTPEILPWRKTRFFAKIEIQYPGMIIKTTDIPCKDKAELDDFKMHIDELLKLGLIRDTKDNPEDASPHRSAAFIVKKHSEDKRGFFQIKMSPESIKWTAFTCGYRSGNGITIRGVFNDVEGVDERMSSELR
ncbi:hypothetical protein FEM48_Zijuj01G0113000 [Ziziphus jujuba var. spinosa]|uniref:non-specific serine/threonine protein kinase n=1 Tax=Ziziphus jujuba var. spinosa TaxID=714518 RepID=A0A978W0Y8_ZIZJJ|nr:hypothetical protein FEM48_Zijuj01G0113000 [Ziziphus jujuba var. spinosa]